MSAKGITVAEVLRARGWEPEKHLMWSVGREVRQVYFERTGQDPRYDRRRKTGGGGSHCFAIYPESWADFIARRAAAKSPAPLRQPAFDLLLQPSKGDDRG